MWHNRFLSLAFLSQYIKCETSELLSISSSPCSSCTLLFFFVPPLYHILTLPFLPSLPPHFISQSSLSYPVSSLSLHKHIQTLKQTLSRNQEVTSEAEILEWDSHSRDGTVQVNAPAKLSRTSVVASLFLSVSVWSKTPSHKTAWGLKRQALTWIVWLHCFRNMKCEFLILENIYVSLSHFHELGDLAGRTSKWFWWMFLKIYLIRGDAFNFFVFFKVAAAVVQPQIRSL